MSKSKILLSVIVIVGLVGVLIWGISAIVGVSTVNSAMDNSRREAVVFRARLLVNSAELCYQSNQIQDSSLSHDDLIGRCSTIDELVYRRYYEGGNGTEFARITFHDNGRVSNIQYIDNETQGSSCAFGENGNIIGGLLTSNVSLEDIANGLIMLSSDSCR